MALEITNTWQAVSAGNPTLVKKIGPVFTTSATKAQTTGGTVVNVDTYNTVTVNSNTGGRAYITGSLTLKANTPYVIMARFANVSIPSAAENNMCVKLISSTSLSLGDASASVSNNGLWAIVVQYSIDKTVDFRIGAGANNTVSNCSADISDLTIYQLPSFIPVGGALPPPLGGYTGTTRGPHVYNKEFVNTYNANGFVTEASRTVPITAKRTKYRFGVYVSDSFGNDAGDWPDILSGYGIGIMGGSWPGQNMTYLNTKAQDVFSLSGVTLAGDVGPDFAICQSSLNSANGGHSAATMLADMTSIITKAKTAGLKPFVPNMTPFGLGGMSTAEESQLLAYNAALPALCATLGAVHIDVYTLVSDPGNRSNLLAAYASDNVHLNAAGVAVYAEAINGAIVRQRKLLGLTRPLVSNLVSSLTSSMVSN